MANKRYVYWGTIGLGLALGIGLVSMEPVAGPQKAERRLVAPTFKVDPFWPKPLPDNWVTGEPGGTCIDSQDHLIIVTRGFQTGGLASPEGVGGADTKTGERGSVYVADGYGNHRVAVFDRRGKYLRQMGGVGTGPGQFAPGGGGHPHCVVIGNNGLVYACDRANDRVNVYQRNGTFVRSIPVVPGTGNPGIGTAGSAWDVDFSPDREQTFMYERDGGNEIMWIVA